MGRRPPGECDPSPRRKSVLPSAPPFRTKLPRRRLLPDAFTLIELLASSILAAMLMIVIVGLVRTTHAQSRAARRAWEANPATSILADQIRRDFVNARHWEMRSNQVRLSGYLAQDLRTGKQTFRPAEVVYAIVTSRQSTWLLRQEAQFDEVIGKRVRRDALWQGAAALEVVPGSDDAEFESASGAAPPGMTALPSRLLLAVRDPSGKPIFDEEILHHDIVR